MSHAPLANSPFSALLAAILLFVTGSAVASEAERGFADPLLGRWDLTVQSPDGKYPSWLEVRLRKEGQLMGSFVGRFGSMRHAAAVNFADGQVEFRVPVQYERNADDLVFIGELLGDRLAGKTYDAHGDELSWSGVRAPTLYRNAPLSRAEPIALINSNNLQGWRPRNPGRPDCWSVEDGMLIATPPCVDLISEQSFDDFELHLEFMYPSGSNSGLYLRGRYEVQIQDDAGKALDPLRFGGVYGFIAPTMDAARPAGEWQVMDVTLIGRRISITLNGTEIIVDREIPGITGGALDSNEAAPGPLMLQGDHGPIRYRNIILTPRR